MLRFASINTVYVQIAIITHHNVEQSYLCETMIQKTLVALCCLIVTVLAADKYSDKYDNVNVEEIVSNKRLLNPYVDCILDKGKCTAEGKALKDNIQDALETGCEKCTETQKAKTEFVIKHMVVKEPAIWNEMTAKFDPEGTYKKKYEDLAKEHGIDLP